MPSKNCYHKIQTHNRVIVIKILSHLLTSSPAVSNVLNLGKFSYKFPVNSSPGHTGSLCVAFPQFVSVQAGSLCSAFTKFSLFSVLGMLVHKHPLQLTHIELSVVEWRPQTHSWQRIIFSITSRKQQEVDLWFLHAPSVSDIFCLCFSNQNMLAS